MVVRAGLDQEKTESSDLKKKKKEAVQCILTYPHPFVQAKKIFFRITEKFGYVKCIEKYISYREFYYNMNIIKMFMNNVVILLLAVRICKDSDKRGCTVCRILRFWLIIKI